jgi:2-octaprenyl-6-methoxyphenol hydroxylase
LALAPSWRVALIERHLPQALPTTLDDWDNRIYAISPGSRAMLAGIGGWALPDARVGTIRMMDVRGDAGGAICFDALDLAAERLASTVENRALQAALWQALAGRVTTISDASLAAAEFGERAVTLSLADGRVLRAKLAVAADGAQSWLRQQAGVEFRRQPYHQRGVVANFRTAKPHGNIARQWFRKDGILAWLPLPGNRISIVWSTNDAHAAELCALSPAELAVRVASAGGQALGDFETLTPAAAFPLALGRAERAIGQRLALVGDAAHTVHPLAGQGVNLGFGDVKVLAEVLDQALAKAAGACDPGDAMLLSRYARGRAEDVLVMQTLCDGLQKLFGRHDPLTSRLRNVGLSFTHRAGPLKRSLMRHAFQ